MTTSPPLLLTAHSAAALLVLLGPTARSRKRLRRDEAGSASDAEATDPDPAPAPAPQQATPAAAPEQETPPPAPLPLPPKSLDDYPLAFRVSAPTFHFLSGLLDPLLSHPSLPSPVLLALALARLASGLPYPDLAALFHVPPSAPRAASRRLRRVLLANFRFWLAFPSDPTSAYSAPLPSCRGALCCARFAGPTGPLAAQIVAGASSRVLSLAAGFRGDRTDLEVLRLSSLYQEVEQGKLLDSQQYLVGDGGGYPLLPWLMVPFPGPVVPGSPEAEFNAAHRAMCRPVRRAIRSLMGWGAIARLHEEESSRAAVACIGTCAMLHNGRDWLGVSGAYRPAGCKNHLFGWLDNEQNLAERVQRAPPGQALRKRERLPFPAGQARSVQCARSKVKQEGVWTSTNQQPNKNS